MAVLKDQVTKEEDEERAMKEGHLREKETNSKNKIPVLHRDFLFVLFAGHTC